MSHSVALDQMCINPQQKQIAQSLFYFKNGEVYVIHFNRSAVGTNGPQDGEVRKN